MLSAGFVACEGLNFYAPWLGVGAVALIGPGLDLGLAQAESVTLGIGDYRTWCKNAPSLLYDVPITGFLSQGLMPLF